MKIKTLAVALALAAVGTSAHAAINPGYSATAPLGSEMFVTVFDPSAQISYSLDLGIYHNNFIDTNTAGPVNLALDPNFSQFVGQTDLRFTVESVYRIMSDIPDLPYFGVLTTTSTSEATILAQVPDFAALNARQDKISTWALNLNADAGMGASNAVNDLQNNSEVSVIGDIGYYGNPIWGDTMGNSGFVTSSTVGTAIAFYAMRTSDQDYDTTVLTNMGSWNLSTAGMLTYTAAGVNPVPVPAAAWLFGSGLLGLIGVARRKAA
jgi:hypothetical protein